MSVLARSGHRAFTDAKRWALLEEAPRLILLATAVADFRSAAAPFDV